MIAYKRLPLPFLSLELGFLNHFRCISFDISHQICISAHLAIKHKN